jgi:aspartyl aminopeptidase
MSQNATQELLEFISHSPTCFHASENFSQLFRSAGFTELSEGQIWQLKPGSGYFVRRDSDSVIAFRTPAKPMQSIHCSCAHIDSPAFRMKGKIEMTSEGYTRLNVEKYGGMLPTTWFDRPLSVAGRVIVEEEGQLVTRLVNVDRDLLLIPHLAIHMDRTAGSGDSIGFQTDMIPLYGDESARGTFLDTVAETVGHKGEDILSYDLFLYNRMKGTFWGANNEFIAAPHLDDLQCAYGITQGFLAGGNENALSLVALLDNEEVGSNTKNGADSDFLTSTLQRIREALGMSFQEYRAALASGFMVSADNAHAKHPNHPEKADPTTYPLMNRGPVIKFHGGQRYATDATSAAIFRTLCQRAEVPFQYYNNHSDQPGGGTMGNISTSQVSLNTVDIGLPQLAMHSSYETAGAKDLDYLIQVMTEYYASCITLTGSGVYQINR